MNKLKFIIGSSFCLVLLLFLFSSAKQSNSEQHSLNNELSKGGVERLIEKYSGDDKTLEIRKELLSEAISSYFTKAVKRGDIIGAGISVVHGSSLIYADGFGYSDAYKQSKVNEETVFRLGSLSKGFTGVLAGMLQDKGDLDLDDKVVECIPEFQLGSKENTDKITLNHILSHTSGTPYHSYTDLVEGGLSLERIAGMFKRVNPISSPGELYSYQNAMFALSSEMIERSTGISFNESLKSKIFDPLNMESTSVTFSDIKYEDNIALPHRKRRNYWKPLKLTDKYFNAVAAGGVNASAQDMAQWMKLLLGQYPEIVPEKTLNEVFKPRIEIAGSRKYYQKWPGHVSSHYSLGWRILEFESHDNKEIKKIIHHGGSVNNYRNEIAIYPDDDLGICVLLNSYSKISKKVIPDLYAIITEVINQPAYNLYNSEQKAIALSTIDQR